MKGIQIPDTNSAGEIRCVGYELEFSGIELAKVANIIQSLYGGSVAKVHRYRYEINDTRFGTFRAELDAQNMRRMAEENAFKNWGIDFNREKPNSTIEDLVDRITQTVVPLEVVMPPVPLNQLEELESLREKLQHYKAQGTSTSLIHAFGMHINIECPSLSHKTLLQYMPSFVLLYPWLMRELEIDLARKITPFVDRFPEKYVRLILDPDYQPDEDELVGDYLKHNPTRNRPLDMMPIWSLNFKGRVQATLKDEKNMPRPTFHYRMPNSFVDDTNWRLTKELDYWMKVELLAQNDEMVQKLSRLYLLQKERILSPFDKNWAKIITILLTLDE